MSVFSYFLIKKTFSEKHLYLFVKKNMHNYTKQ